MACTLDFLSRSLVHARTSERGNKLWADMTPTPTGRDATFNCDLPAADMQDASSPARRARRAALASTVKEAEEGQLCSAALWATREGTREGCSGSDDGCDVPSESETSTLVSFDNPVYRTISNESVWSRQSPSGSTSISDWSSGYDRMSTISDVAANSQKATQAVAVTHSNIGVHLSVGSMEHDLGNCKPCAWFHKRAGCQNGVECRHCHICVKGEIRRRKKDRLYKNRQEEEQRLSEGRSGDDC
eukprot:TRINITY_DN4913_c0_g1_i3.p1 TRINITY_DN4913_c0_g1~~TRINITY_DN4913_c0_g1_i3.p1  ORF type:complete len:245 (-),score=55.07 TRINITY_DN4913_c0_g1_i3:485-1219(-)